MKDIESPDYRYTQWGGNERGFKQDPLRCVKEVMNGYIGYQCQFKRKHGLYCGKHKPKEENKNV